MNAFRRLFCHVPLLALYLPALSAKVEKLALQFVITSRSKSPEGQTETRFYRNKLYLDFDQKIDAVFPREYEMSIGVTAQEKGVQLDIKLRDILSTPVEVGTGKVFVPLGGAATLEFPPVAGVKYSVQYKAERVSVPLK